MRIVGLRRNRPAADRSDLVGNSLHRCQFQSQVVKIQIVGRLLDRVLKELKTLRMFPAVLGHSGLKEGRLGIELNSFFECAGCLSLSLEDAQHTEQVVLMQGNVRFQLDGLFDMCQTCF